MSTRVVRFTYLGLSGSYDGDSWTIEPPAAAESLRLQDDLLPAGYFPTLGSRVRAVLAAAGGGEVIEEDKPDDLPEDAIP